MKIREVIDMADVLRPNDVPENLKVEALLRLDAEYADLMDDDHVMDGVNTELLVPFPHDLLYISYLKAFIDNAQEDSALYADDSQEYNADDARFRAWYSRNFQKRQISGWRV